MNITDTLVMETIKGIGGKENIQVLDCCITRLRITLNDISLRESDSFFQNLGYKGVVLDNRELQLVFGAEAVTLKQKIQQTLGN